jgi:membrane-associated protein
VIAGDVFLYAFGHRVGHGAVTHPRLARRFPPERLARARRFFDRWGTAAIVVARFVLGVRAAVYFTAGTLRMPFARFLAVDALASLVHVPALVLLGRWAGAHFDRVSARVASVKLVALGVVIAAAIAAFVLERRRAGREARRRDGAGP